MVIEELETKKKSKHVLEQILEEIKEGKYQIGDRLPSEEELAKKTKVSRTSVREALSALRLTEIVESRGSKGTVIKEDPSEFSSDSVISLLKKEVSPTEVLEAREVLSKGAIPFIIERIEENNVKKLKKLLSQMKEAARDNNLDRYLNLNKKFHLTIFNVMGNDLVTDMADTILSYTEEGLGEAERRFHYESNEESFKKSIKIHEEIVNSLREDEQKAFEEALLKHFDRLGIKNTESK